MPNKHLKYGGSTIARTMACPGWASLAETIPQVRGRASDAAEEGTALHEAMEHLVEFRLLKAPGEIQYEIFNDITITEEMVRDRLRPACDAVLSLMDRYRLNYDSMHIEPFVEIIPDRAGGSIDLLCPSADGKTVVLIDYKFGHMPVSAGGNLQLMFYALCADADPATAELFAKCEEIVLAIIQPAHPEGPLLTFRMDVNELDDFDGRVAKAIGEAEGKNPRFHAGDHCLYCPAQAVCPIKTGEADAAAKLPAVHVEALDKYMPMLTDLEKWIASVRALAQQHMEKGGKVEGFKLVNKRPTRIWTDEAEVEALLKKKRIPKPSMYTTKLNSPAQMEKEFKQRNFDPDMITDYISSVSSGLTVAPESDKREAAMPEAALKAALSRL